MCKIFNSKNLKAMEPGDGLPFTSFDQNELQQKEKGNGKEREKAKEKAQIGTRSKRDTKSVNPALTVKDEERVEKIVDKIYDDLLEKGHKIPYKHKELPTVDEKGKMKATNITGRRFPFAPLTMEGPITDEVKPNTSIIETKTPRFHHAIVPFFIDSRTYDAHLSEKILEAFDYFEKATCVRLQRLRERPTDQSSLQNVVWLYITNPSGIRQCVHSNEKAEIKGVQMIVFGYDCMSVGDISHEIMHILGFSHEHTRPDRDQYITILWDNVKPGYRKFFEIEQTHTHLDNLPYDYASVLHYPARAFSRNGQVTILTDSNIKIGQREGLSEMDVEKVGMLYSNECVKRNREYLVMTCPSVVRSQRAQPTPVSQEDIEEYFEYRLWPYGIINYQFKDKLEFSGEEIENINAVIRHIEKETCIEFRDLSDMQFSAETDSSEESAAAVEHGNDDNVNQETDLDDAGGKPEQSDTNDNKTEKEIPNSSEIKDVDKQTNKNTNNVDNDKNKHTIQNFLDTSSQDGVNPYDKLNDSDDDEKYKPVPYSKATDDEDKPYNALKRTDNAENGKISKGLNIRDGYRPRNNLNNNMRDQKKNSEPGKLSVGSKLKGIMLKEIKASNSSATSKYSLNLQQVPHKMT
uniref:Metalloendopeptidase n=1 Tax=Spodoptera frugiperda TaxID=7108 RepID=A0A2H1WVK9_SPOFR